MRKRQLIMVEWEDTATYGAWRAEGKTSKVKPMLVQTVGWKMKAPSSRKLALASSRNNIDECCDMTVILKADIKSIRRLDYVPK